MTLLELIESLEHLAEELGEEKAAETEVRLAVQPRWPFEHDLAGIALSSDLRRGGEDEDEESVEVTPPVVYLVEGTQLGYAPPGIWEAAR